MEDTVYIPLDVISTHLHDVKRTSYGQEEHCYSTQRNPALPLNACARDNSSPRIKHRANMFYGRAAALKQNNIVAHFSRCIIVIWAHFCAVYCRDLVISPDLEKPRKNSRSADLLSGDSISIARFSLLSVLPLLYSLLSLESISVLTASSLYQTNVYQTQTAGCGLPR